MFRKSWLALLALVLVSGSARADHPEVTVVRLMVSDVVSAPAGAVWTYMTTGKNFATWCPNWKSDKNAAMTLTKVGDVLEFTDDWGNKGRSVVTHFVKDKEMRVAHEPNDGSYMCQARLVLEPTDKGTRVRYLEQYTDESKAEDRQATATKVEVEMKAALAALKKSIEQK